MKLLLLILSFSINTYAENWHPLGKDGANTTYSKASVCKEKEGQDCIEISGKDLRYHDLLDVEVDDYSKPTYSAKYKVEACADMTACSEAVKIYNGDWDKPLAQKYCDQDIRDQISVGPNDLMPGYSYWCWRQSGWDKKTVKKLLLNATKKTEIESFDLARETQQNAIGVAIRKMSQGKQILALVAVRNAQKGLNKGQIKQMHETYSLIKSMLDSGSLDSARDEISAIVPDANIVTQDDKDAIIAELDKYLVQ